jgi:hypothetical protein
LITNKKSLTNLAIIVGAAEFTWRGSDLIGLNDQLADENDDYNDVWPFLFQDPQFEQYMPSSRWKDLQNFFSDVFTDGTKTGTDPWHHISAAFDEFNIIHQSELLCSPWISTNLTMSAWKPRKTALGGLLTYDLWFGCQSP